LEECASLHRTTPTLDEESKGLSAGLSVNSYLGRIVFVPDSLSDAWALQPYPKGPLRSKGSGRNRGSLLGLLIALYEHRSDGGSNADTEGGDEAQNANDGHGGARTLAVSGLKWLLRFVSSLVDGAPSVGIAVRSATTGRRFVPSPAASTFDERVSFSWTIDEQTRVEIRSMLSGLADLWPKPKEITSPSESASASAVKSKEARKSAQLKVMEMMKQKQAAFAATILPLEGASSKPENVDGEGDLCIICRCDDADGGHNGPLGYLGHVQRSRTAQVRAMQESRIREGPPSVLNQAYCVVGRMGCQVSRKALLQVPIAPFSCLCSIWFEFM
jgi:hypothetical protein